MNKHALVYDAMCLWHSIIDMLSALEDDVHDKAKPIVAAADTAYLTARVMQGDAEKMRQMATAYSEVDPDEAAAMRTLADRVEAKVNWLDVVGKLETAADDLAEFVDSL